MTNLLTPPPAQQRPVHEPGLDSKIRESGQVGLYQIFEDVFLFVVGQCLFRESSIVVRMKPSTVKSQHATWTSWHRSQLT